MQTYEVSKRRRAVDTLPLELAPTDPTVAPAVAWDDNAFWESFFNPLLLPQPFAEPLPEPTLDDGNPQSSSTRKRR
jgi:hypothetical protein